MHIPYKGGPPATTDVVAGQVPIGFAPIPLVRVLRAPELAAQFRAQCVEPAHSTPQEFFATIEADLKKWGKVIAEAGIKGE